MDMIEKVARAIANTPRKNDTFGDGAREWYLDQARAAIAAMREPTPAMLDAGAAADIPGGRWGEDTFRESSVDNADVAAIWADMIDAALI